MKYSKASQEGAKQLLNSLGSTSYLYSLGYIIRVRTSLLRRIYSASLLWAFLKKLAKKACNSKFGAGKLVGKRNF